MTVRSDARRPDVDRYRPGRRPVLLPAAISVMAAALTALPIAGRGWLLLLDWSTGPGWPRGGWDRTHLPSGPVFWLAARIATALPWHAEGWALIAVPVAVAGIGAARLAPGGPVARSVTALAVAWNPWVFERAATGQVAVLAGYAVLPWLVAAVRHPRTGRDGWKIGILWALGALCSVHLAVIVLPVVVVGVLVRPRDHALVDRRGVRGVLGRAILVPTVALVVCLSIAPGALPPAGGAAAIDTFASRPDPDLGLTLGLLTQQGFWRPSPTSVRWELGSLFPVIGCTFVGFALLGLWYGSRRSARSDTRVMAVSGAALGAVGLLLAHGTAGPVGVLYRLALHLPGGAMMREPQKWVALVALATGIGLGLLVDRVATTAATRSAGGHPHLLRMVVGAVVVLQLVLGSGFVRGIVEPGVVHYPASWDEAASVLAREPGRAVAVPWRSYLRLGFVGDRVVGGAVRARFGDRVETGTASGVEGLTRDDERGAAVAAAIDEVIADESGEASLSLGAQLRVLGVAWVVEVRESSGDPAPALAHDPDLDLVVDGAELRLWRVVPLLTIDN